MVKPSKEVMARHAGFTSFTARFQSKGFHTFFFRWVRELSESLKGKTVAIDGKKLRGSYDRINGKAAILMVSAWATDIRLVLGQLKTDDKSNEITAIAGTAWDHYYLLKILGL